MAAKKRSAKKAASTAKKRPPAKMFVVYSTKTGTVTSMPLPKRKDAKGMISRYPDAAIAVYGLLERKAT